ncbi:hypothetical protein CH267_10860 [Rhodococcus sp. 06-621-2]|nr:MULTISPECIES: hypothetical protein [unclassified Rhodococcus (in: high G+C Gram-positive bacteria)]OZC56056.1 hypothetical protein CH267_10860 [Rhodococcus sp. 06-621-2]OZD69089.1 hypothetical protein CH263_08045 [Rhodococcus sp. 06-1059B-a]
MATDNHRQTAVLFPDPQEYFDPQWQQMAADHEASPVIEPTDDTPTDDMPTDDPFVDNTDEDANDGYAPATGGGVDSDVSGFYPQGEADEPARVPYWVSAHVPADRLVMDEPNRRFRRRRPTAPPPPAPDTSAAAPQTPPAAPHRPRSVPIGWVAAGVLAAASLIGAAVVVTGHDETPATPAAAAPEQPPAPRTSATTAALTTPAAAPWCTTAATADATTTDDAGNRASAVGVIAAFEHAYYVQRSGTAVAALMTSPAPAERIQAVIDRTPAGTEHCVTIAATDIPDVHAVALSLRTPSGSESAIASRITTTRTGESYAIANVEEVR